MSPVVPRNVRLDETVWEALRQLEARDGIPVAEQIRRAVADWLTRKGVQPTAKPASHPKRRTS